jgi:hypothetical protein
MTPLDVSLLVVALVLIAGVVHVSWDYLMKRCPWCHKPWNTLGDRTEHNKVCAKAHLKS